MEDKIPEFSFKQLIYYVYQDTVFPEIYELIGEKNTLKLLSVFGGIRVTFPSDKELKALKRNIDIFKTLSYSQSTETTRMLGKKYDITTAWVHALYKQTRREFPKILKSIQKIEDPEMVHITTRRNFKYGLKNEKESSQDCSQ